MRQLVITLSLSVSGALILAGCQSSKELTREKAKELIGKNDQFKPQHAPFPMGSVKVISAGEAVGYWTRGKLFGTYQFTAEARQDFSNLLPNDKQWPFGGPGTRMLQETVIPVSTLIPYVTEVTGITDGTNGAKQVEYRWNFKWEC